MASNLRFDVEANDNASSAFAAVAAEARAAREELQRLDGMRVKPKVEIKGASPADLARIRDAAAALRDLDGRNARARVQIDGDIDPAQVRQLRAVAKALRELDGTNAVARAEVTGDLPDPKNIRATARALKQLQDIGVVHVRVEVSGAADELAAIIALGRALRNLPEQETTRVKTDVDKDAPSRVAALGKALAGIGFSGGLAAAGAINATASIMSLVGALGQAAGVAPIAAGALAGYGVVLATVKTGLTGIGDALKAAGEDPKKFAESLKGLAPAGRDFAIAYRQVSDSFKGVQFGTQQKLLAGWGAEVRKIGATYMPTLHAGMGGVASELNNIGKGVSGFVRQASTVRDVNTIFANTKQALQNATPAAGNLLSVVRDIATVGSAELPELATSLANGTARLKDFVAQARQSGQLAEWIDTGKMRLQQLGSVAGNVGSILGSVFKAATASGADFLSVLDNVTGRVADALKSPQGRDTLAAVFREARSAVDAFLPGIDAVGRALSTSIGNFARSGALREAADAISDLAQSVAPLAAQLGGVAASALTSFAGAGKIAAGALAPIAGLVAGVLSALGPLPGIVLAAVVAFKALSSAAVVNVMTALTARVAAAGVALTQLQARMTGTLGPGNAAGAATARLTGALQKMGSALPLAGVALIALGAAYEEFGSTAEANAAKVISGSQSVAQAIAAEQKQVEHGQAFWFSAAQQQEAYAQAADNVRAKIQEQYNALSPFQKLQADVAMAQADLNDAVAQYGAKSPEATAAAAALAGATDRLKGAQTGAADAAKTHEQRLQELADTMSAQANTALAYEQAVRRTADAQKAASDALKASGANSDEYKSAVLDLAVAINSQAEAARKQAEALGGTEAGARAYSTEILKAANLSTTAGRDAFAKLAGGLDDAGLAALSATAKMSGLRTEVVTLPDGRKVTVVVEADRSKLDTVKQGVDELTRQKYVGTVTILGESSGLRGEITRSVQLADGTKATISIGANGAPAMIAIGQTKYTIDATTGTMKILGDPAPGEANLSGLKVRVDSTTGAITIDAATGPADQKIMTAKSLADSSIGIITIDGNATLAQGKTTSAVTFANGSRGTITIDGNQTPANGKITATVTYANGSRGTIQVDANSAAANNAINNAARNRTSTIFVKYSFEGGASAGNARLAGAAIGGIVSPMRDGGVVGMAGGGGVTHRLTPLRGGVAQVVKPNTWRVVGDRLSGDEAYIPINGSPRSRQILRETASRMGYALTQQDAIGRASAVRRGTSAAGAAAARGIDLGPLLGEVATLRSALVAVAGASDSAEVVAELRALRGPLVEAVRTSVATAAQARRSSAELQGIR